MGLTEAIMMFPAEFEIAQTFRRFVRRKCEDFWKLQTNVCAVSDSGWNIGIAREQPCSFLSAHRYLVGRASCFPKGPSFGQLCHALATAQRKNNLIVAGLQGVVWCGGEDLEEVLHAVQGARSKKEVGRTSQGCRDLDRAEIPWAVRVS